MSCLEENVTSKGRPNAEIEIETSSLLALGGCAAVFDLLTRNLARFLLGPLRTSPFFSRNLARNPSRLP